MTITTAKGSYSASTLAAMATIAVWHAEMDGAFASIEIGARSVDVTDAESAEDMALLIRANLSDVFQTLADEAAAAGDDEMAALALDAIDTGSVRAVEACCNAICDAYGA